MADAKISQLPVATTPLAGTELVPVVQGGVTDQTTVEAILTGTVPSGTANGVLYLNGSKVVTSGTDLVFNATGLGIGTSSPNARLTTISSASGVGAQINTSLVSAGSTAIQLGGYTVGFESNTGVTLRAIHNHGATNASSLAFEVNGTTEAMRIDSSGNLGLGVTPSAWAAPYKVMQAGTTSFWGGQSGSEIVRVGTNAYNDGTWKYAVSGNFASIYQQSSGQHIWYNAPSWDGTGSNAISFTQAMTLDASGNLGVGTTSPAAATTRALQVTGANGSTVRVTGASSVTGFDLTQGGGGDSYLWNRDNNFLAFGTNNTERARITSGGNVCINTLSELIDSGRKLSVVGGSVAGSFKVASVSEIPVEMWNAATSGDNLFSQFGTEASFTQRGSIDYDRAGGLVRYNTTSDYRAKDIIGPVQNPGATIDSLKVYEGVMKGATRSRPMLIAHEAQEHAPYAVSGAKDEVNEDGTPKFQQMDVSSLVPLLLAEIQSLRARVAALEA